MPLRPSVVCDSCNRTMIRHCLVSGCGWMICHRCGALYNLRKKFYLKQLEE